MSETNRQAVERQIKSGNQHAALWSLLSWVSQHDDQIGDGQIGTLQARVSALHADMRRLAVRPCTHPPDCERCNWCGYESTCTCGVRDDVLPRSRRGARMTHVPAALLYRLIHDAHGAVLIASEDDTSDPFAALDLAQEKLEEAMDLILRWDDLAKGLSPRMDASGTFASPETEV